MNQKEFISRKGFAVILPKGASYTLHGDKEGLFPLINFDAKGIDIKEFLVLPIQNEEHLIKEYELIKVNLLAGNRIKTFEKFYGLINKIITQQEKTKNPVSPATDYIEKNYSDASLSNQDLAKLLGMSEVNFRKIFSACCKVTPKQYILDFRIQKAKQLLTNTAYSVTDISELCGFGSLYHFCRAFKTKVGITPTEYARQNKIYKI